MENISLALLFLAFSLSLSFSFSFMLRKKRSLFEMLKRLGKSRRI